MDFPHGCPLEGLCIPVEFVRAIDVDTQEYRLPLSERVVISRNLEVWGPELHRGDEILREIARRGKQWVHDELYGRQNIRLFIPLPQGKNPFSILSFDRLLSYVFVGDMCLNKEAVRKGFASSGKGGPLGI